MHGSEQNGGDVVAACGNGATYISGRSSEPISEHVRMERTYGVSHWEM